MVREKYFEKTFKITDDDIKMFAEVSGDMNPLHLDEEYAKNTVYQERICHGMLIGSYISSIIGNDFPGIGTIYLSQNLIFKKPVKIGDTIIITVSYLEELEKGRVGLETICKNQYGDIVVDGKAIVIPPKDFICRFSKG